jgi:hypothetical protein
MASDHIIDIISPQPGIQRDGTKFDTKLCIDGQWCRFYRGRPKKIGGQLLLDPGTNEIIRNIYNVDQQNNVTDCYLGRASSLSVASVTNGISKPEFDRTPAGFTINQNNNWTFDRYTVLDVIFSTVNLNNNPLTTTTGSNIIVVSVASTVGLFIGKLITISGAVGFNGLFDAQLNISTTITNIVPNVSFSYSVEANATGTGAGGGNAPVTYSLSGPVNYIIAHAAQNVIDMNNSIESLIYWGDTAATTPLTIMSPNAPQLASGGIVVLYPYFFKYTNDGVVAYTLNPGGDWSDASIASIAGTKIIKGLITRGGSNAPSGLFWSLNSLIKATFVGPPEIFKFDTIQSDISLLSQNCIVTHDNVFYWIGMNQFYLYNGVVKKIRNVTNKITFFKNLNFAYRNKVWGMYKEEYNEIWWYYPSGNNTECSDVIIYNIEEDFWFDSIHARSAGTTTGLYDFPLETDSIGLLNKFNPAPVSFNLANNPLSTTVNQNIVVVTIAANTILRTGMLVTISGAVGFNGLTAIQLNLMSVPIRVINPTSFSYIVSSNATGTGAGGGNAPVTYSYPNLTYGLWQEETGVDRVLYGQSYAIDSYFETNIMTWFEKAPTDDRQIRIRRIEPDFIQAEPMTMIVKTRDFAQSIVASSQSYTFSPGQEIVTLAKIDTNNMGRLVSFRFESNVSGGDYEMGRIVLNYAPGDVKP